MAPHARTHTDNLFKTKKVCFLFAHENKKVSPYIHTYGERMQL